MLRLGREVRLGGALLRLGRPKRVEIQALSSPRSSDLCLGDRDESCVHFS